MGAAKCAVDDACALLHEKVARHGGDVGAHPPCAFTVAIEAKIVDLGFGTRRCFFCWVKPRPFGFWMGTYSGTEVDWTSVWVWTGYSARVRLDFPLLDKDSGGIAAQNSCHIPHIPHTYADKRNDPWMILSTYCREDTTLNSSAKVWKEIRNECKTKFKFQLQMKEDLSKKSEPKRSSKLFINLYEIGRNSTRVSTLKIVC